jgi:hypothetical protein
MNFRWYLQHLQANVVYRKEHHFMANEKEPKGPSKRPVVEEINLESALRILNQKGFDRLIQVSRDPKTGHIIDVVLREA